LYITAGSTLMIAACGDTQTARNNSPIVLGDTSTIIIEKDSQYLKDEVMDLVPAQRASAETNGHSPDKKRTVATADTARALATHEQTASGHTISFGDTKIVFTGIQAKDGRRQNADRDAGLTYVLQSGNPAASKLYVYGAKNVTVKLRYQSRLMLKSNLGSVDLRDLGLYTSGWNTVQASPSAGSTSFGLSTLNNIDYAQVNNNKIKNAADRELRKRRTNSRTIQNWMKEIRKVRNADDDPCEIILDNVQWQISGTDAHGRAFQKNIRMDV
jgi:hypothetical protein